MPLVLLVDDDHQMRTAIRRMMAPLGYEIDEAANGKEALKKFAARPADLVICDMFMPDQDGLEVIRALTSQFIGVKIIALSGGGFNGELDVLPIARLFGACGVLYKPFETSELLNIVRQIMH
jgi:CheY-like chemotaxis protein